MQQYGNNNSPVPPPGVRGVSQIQQPYQQPQGQSASTATADNVGPSAPRVVLGIVVGMVLVGCVFGVLALASSSMEQAQLAASGASGSEYLGSMVTDVLGVGLLAPAVPAILLMVFAVRPTRSTRTAAIVGLVLWWALWVFAGFIMLPIQVGGVDAREALDLMWVFFALAIPPAASTLCVYLASRNQEQGGVAGV